MPPDEPNDEEALEELPEDGDTPFRPATVARSDPDDQNLDREAEESRVDDTHPSFDTDQQPEELYDQGPNLDEPNAGNAVAGYDPTKDQRLKKKKS